MDTVDQGRIGEAAIVSYFVQNGFDVFLPQFGNTACDLIVLKDNEVSRVECKSTRSKTSSGKYEVQLRQTRNNKTSSNVKKFNADNSEILAIYIVPENKVIILDSKDYDGRTSVNVK